MKDGKILYVGSEAVTRASAQYGISTTRNPAEVLTRYEALLGLTRNAAYLCKDEDRIGSLEIGKEADMAVFDTDFLTAPLEDLVSAAPVATVVHGEIVYKA